MPQRRLAKEDRFKAILEVELIGISGGVAMGRLSDGWPVQGMEYKRESGDRRGRATMAWYFMVIY